MEKNWSDTDSFTSDSSDSSLQDSLNTSEDSDFELNGKFRNCSGSRSLTVNFIPFGPFTFSLFDHLFSSLGTDLSRPFGPSSFYFSNRPLSRTVQFGIRQSTFSRLDHLFSPLRKVQSRPFSDQSRTVHIRGPVTLDFLHRRPPSSVYDHPLSVVWTVQYDPPHFHHHKIAASGIFTFFSLQLLSHGD